MVLQKRPCFCSPAARPDIYPDLRGETGQHGAKPCPLIWPLGTATHDAAIAGCLPPILAPADADLPGKPDPADRAAGLDRVERDPFGSARTSAQAYARGELTTCLRYSLDHLERRPWSREAALLAARCLSRLDFADAAEPHYERTGELDLNDLQIRAFGLVQGNHRLRNPSLRADPGTLA